MTNKPVSDLCLSARGVWRIFGSRRKRAFELADTGASRADVRTATGATIGVRDVSFDVLRGETFVVMGLSGSGKSTLVRCLARLSPVDRGTVILEGEDLTTMNDAQLRNVRRAKLSMVFQHFGLFPHRRVVDNVAYGLEIQGTKRKDRHHRANEILDLVGLSGSGLSYPHQLSGGMQQRVGLARALAVEPTVLFFDEPFSALDPLIRRDMQNELLRIQTDIKGTIIFITHDFDEAIRLGDRIAVMKDGEFDQVGTAADLILNPATEYVAEFVKGVPRTKVLTAADVVTPVDRAASANPDGKRVVHDTVNLESILPLLIETTEDVFVVDAQDSLLGVVDREAVTNLLQPKS